MKVYIFGYKGGMANRYKTILRSRGHEVGGEDIEGMHHGFKLEDADAVIVATPTSTHVDMLRRVGLCGKPILVEKPVSFDMTELERLVDDLKAFGTQLRMVDQYRYIIQKHAPMEGLTYYNYFKHGSDGPFDFINIVYHARGPVDIQEDSPVWFCVVNGRRLSIADMDQAYIDMVEDWLRDPAADYDHILEAHRKVHRLIDAGQR